MSDRAQGSVRTDSRKGAGAGGVPVAAAAGAGRPAGGATAAGGVGSNPAAAAKRPAPAGVPEERPVEQTQAARSGRSAAGAAQAATPASVVEDGTQVITPDSPPSGVFATGPSVVPGAGGGGPMRTAGQAAPGATGEPVAAAGRAPGSTAGASGAAGPGARGAAPVTPVAPAAPRAPAGPGTTAAPAGPDATQSVQLPAGARPAGAATRTAAPTGPATGTSAASPSGGGKERGRMRNAGRGPRRARLQLRHIDTWSALKISLVVSIALFFVWMVAVGILFGVLNGLGVFDTLNDLFGQLGSVSGDAGTNAAGGSDVITAGVVFGGAAVIGLINVVLLTALCTVGAVVYNLCSDLVGGVEVTLAERE
jgi:transmembrane protein DUF3566